ncbi:DUF2304 family protein [Candidatus Berkelbacteria bacterium]|nr:DUF2304 family protein [Candidatus Berkelbacteria bacterium]
MELNISPLQGIGLAIVVLALTKTVADYHRKRESRVMFTFWMSIWIATIILTLFPETTFIAKNYLLGPNQSIGSIIGTGMIFLLFLVYRIYLKTERVERLLREHATELALKNIYTPGSKLS